MKSCIATLLLVAIIGTAPTVHADVFRTEFGRTFSYIVAAPAIVYAGITALGSGLSDFSRSWQTNSYIAGALSITSSFAAIGLGVGEEDSVPIVIGAAALVFGVTTIIFGVDNATKSPPVVPSVSVSAEPGAGPVWTFQLVGGF